MLNIELVAVAPAQGPKGGRRHKSAKMLEEKTTMIGETDMPQVMQSHAMRVATEALDLHDINDCKDMACYIKTVLRLPTTFIQLSLQAFSYFLL
jgi:dynein light chain LC8-type